MILRILKSKLSVRFTAWEGNVAEIVCLEQNVNHALKICRISSLSLSLSFSFSIKKEPLTSIAVLLSKKDAIKDAIRPSTLALG